MRARRLTLLLLVYVTLDLTNPFIPGAFSFNPDECVEGVHRAAARSDKGVAPPPPARDSVRRMERPSTEAVTRARALSQVVADWQLVLPPAQRAAADPSPLSEDH